MNTPNEFFRVIFPFLLVGIIFAGLMLLYGLGKHISAIGGC